MSREVSSRSLLAPQSVPVWVTFFTPCAFSSFTPLVFLHQPWGASRAQLGDRPHASPQPFLLTSGPSVCSYHSFCPCVLVQGRQPCFSARSPSACLTCLAYLLQLWGSCRAPLEGRQHAAPRPLPSASDVCVDSCHSFCPFSLLFRRFVPASLSVSPATLLEDRYAG